MIIKEKNEDVNIESRERDEVMRVDLKNDIYSSFYFFGMIMKKQLFFSKAQMITKRKNKTKQRKTRHIQRHIFLLLFLVR